MNKSLGIIGGGQLGLMLAQTAIKLKIKTLVLDPTPSCPASLVSEQLLGDYKKTLPIKKIASKCDFLTFEIEGTNASALELVENEGKKVNPGPESLRVIQDKLSQKQFLLSNDLPTTEFTQVKNKKEIKKVARYLGYPLVLKSRFHGFDGRGNALIKNELQIDTALKKLKNSMLYVEKFVPFKRELAIQVVKSTNGTVKVYPLVKTIQKNNICHIVIFPSGVNKKIEDLATESAKKCISLLSGAGVFAVEMFETNDGKILINEIAPRVHNSGHWTIEGCRTSQFENHIRAVCGMSIKSTKPKVKSAVMINILGNRNGKANIKGLKKISGLKNTHLHLYNKKETRKERKMGHITVTGNNRYDVLKKAKLARSIISI